MPRRSEHYPWPKHHQINVGFSPEVCFSPDLCEPPTSGYPCRIRDPAICQGKALGELQILYALARPGMLERRAAIWRMPALVASNVLSRREETVAFVPANPLSDPAVSS